MAVIPASATTIADCATGRAANLVSAAYLSFDGPVVVAPAMAPEMLHHSAVARNLDRLRDDGVRVLPPAEGYAVGARAPETGAMCSYDALWDALTECYVLGDQLGQRTNAR